MRRGSLPKYSLVHEHFRAYPEEMSTSSRPLASVVNGNVIVLLPTSGSSNNGRETVIFRATMRIDFTTPLPRSVMCTLLMSCRGLACAPAAVRANARPVPPPKAARTQIRRVSHVTKAHLSSSADKEFYPACTCEVVRPSTTFMHGKRKRGTT